MRSVEAKDIPAEQDIFNNVYRCMKQMYQADSHEKVTASLEKAKGFADPYKGTKCEPFAMAMGKAVLPCILMMAEQQEIFKHLWDLLMKTYHAPRDQIEGVIAEAEAYVKSYEGKVSESFVRQLSEPILASMRMIAQQQDIFHFCWDTLKRCYYIDADEEWDTVIGEIQGAYNRYCGSYAEGFAGDMLLAVMGQLEHTFKERFWYPGHALKDMADNTSDKSCACRRSGNPMDPGDHISVDVRKPAPAPSEKVISSQPAVSEPAADEQMDLASLFDLSEML